MDKNPTQRINGKLLMALKRAVELLRTHVAPEDLGGNRFDLRDAKSMRFIFDVLDDAEGACVTTKRVSDDNNRTERQRDITEYFSAMAMQGILSGIWTDRSMPEYYGEPEALKQHQETIAIASMGYANALFAALSKARNL